MSASSTDAIAGIPPQTGVIVEATKIGPSTTGTATIETASASEQFEESITGRVIVIDDNPPQNQMLKRKLLCIERLEQLVLLDFQAVSQGDFNDSEDSNTVMFNQRVTKRKMQLESVIASLNSAADLDPENYDLAVQQYESAIAAAAAEVALLKIAYTFKVYAKIGPSFSSFIKNYSFDILEFFGETVANSVSGIGITYEQYMLQTNKWTMLGGALGAAIQDGKDLSLLLQLIMDLSFSCCFATPKNALAHPRFSSSGHLLTGEKMWENPHISDGQSNALSRVLAVFEQTEDLSISDINEGYVGLTRISRDLTASMQLGIIAAAQGDEDENLKVVLEKYVETDYFTSTTKMSRSMFGYLFGWDHFASCVPTLSKLGDQDRKEYYVNDFKSHTSGLVSNFFTLDQATIIVSTDSDTYQSAPVISDGLSETIPTQIYGGLEDLVEEAFSSGDGINLGLYETTVTDFQDNLEDVAYTFKQLFRLLDKRGSTLAEAMVITSSTHPSSPLAIYANVIKIFNDRFYTKAPAYLGLAPDLIERSEYQNSDEWYKCWGIFIMIKKPWFAKAIIDKFVEDYRRGFLTFSDTSETVTDDNENTYEVRSNVLPGTTAAVNLSNTRGTLYNYLQDVHQDFEDSLSASKWLTSYGHAESEGAVDGSGTADWYLIASSRTAIGLGGDNDYSTITMEPGNNIIWSPMTPCEAFCGTLYAETDKADIIGDFFMDSEGMEVEGDDFTGNHREDGEVYNIANDYVTGLASLWLFQRMNCWWVRSESDNKVYPINVIGVAGGVIDAVMTTLYNCLSPIMNIEEAGSADSIWPSVKSTSPPYHEQLWTPSAPLINIDFAEGFRYVGGMGSHTNLNTKQWVPVLKAISENLTRSEDKTTYFANAKIGELLYGIVDAFSEVSAVSKNQYSIYHGGKLDPDNAAKVPNTLFTERADSNNLAVPSVPMVSLAGVKAKSINNQIQLSGHAVAGIVDLLGWLSGLVGGESSDQSMNSSIADNVDQMASTPTAEGIGAMAMTVSTVPGSGFGKFIFAGMNSVSSDNADEEEYTAQASQMLSKIWGMESWQDMVYQLMVEMGTMLVSAVSASDDSGELDDVMMFMPDADDISAWALGVAQSNLVIDPSSIPPNLWYMANASGAISNSDSSYEPIGQMLSYTMDQICEEYDQAIPSMCTTESDAVWDYDTAYGNSALLGEAIQIMGKLIQFRDEDIRLGVAFDMLKKYSERIADYAETALDGLQTEDESDPSALEILISDLSNTTAGCDVLQNLTPYQLNLKQIALERQKGNPGSGYISYNELITDHDILAIKTLMAEDSISGVEGLNIKTSVVGIPSTLFNVVGSSYTNYKGPTIDTDPVSSEGVIDGVNSPLFGVQVQGAMPDYPVLQLASKTFRYDYELFCLPDTVWEGVDWDLVTNYRELVLQATFTRVRYICIEGNATSSDSIIKIDESREEVFGDIIADHPEMEDIYHNTLTSYLLERYYKLMVGLSVGEDDLTYVGSGLSIPINDYAVDFASALASIYTDLESGLSQDKIDDLFIPATDIEGLSYSTLTPSAASTTSIASYSAMTQTFSSEIAAGEFSEIESVLFEGFTNAASSRLMSAESMRDKILGAKYFDRVIYNLIDPDEFYVMGPVFYIQYLADIIGWNNHIIGWDSMTVESRQEAANTLLTLYNDWIDQLLSEELIEPTDMYMGGHTYPAEWTMDLEELGHPDTGEYSIAYKVTQRADEGSCSFSSFWSSIMRKGSGNDTYAALSEQSPQDFQVTSATPDFPTGEPWG